jgi:nickel superoxide dismutase
MIYQILKSVEMSVGIEDVKAHCDVPCGIYDSITAQIAILTVVRMVDLIDTLEGDGKEGANSMTR